MEKRVDLTNKYFTNMIKCDRRFEKQIMKIELSGPSGQI